MARKIIVLMTAVAVFLLGVVLQVTTPSSIGPVGLLAVFFLLYIIALGASTGILVGGSRLLHWFGKRIAFKRPVRIFNIRQAYYYSTILAFGPTIAIALRSIGSLGGYEVVLIILFLVVGTVYISRR